MSVRGLSIRGYWAWATVYAAKNPENRARGALTWAHRGTTLIQAAVQLDPVFTGALVETDGGAMLCLEPHRNDPRRPALLAIREAVGQERDPQALEALTVRRAIIGVADLADIHEAQPGCCPSPWAEDGKQPAHLVWEGMRPVWPPVACSGALGMWTPPPEVLEELELTE